MINAKQVIWVMLNNKPQELTVSKVINTEYVDSTGDIQTKTEAYASFTNTYENEYLIDLNEYFATKEALMNHVFEITT